jgi:hypothetical protein
VGGASLFTCLQQLPEIYDEAGRREIEVLDRFSAGEQVGHDLLQWFLVQVHVVRNHPLRLIDRCSDKSKRRASSPPPHSTGPQR